MRALFTIPPGRGELNGALPAATALAAAGHEAAICSAPSFGPYVEAHGLTFFPAGMDWLINDADLLQKLADATGPDLSALAGPDPGAWLTWATNNWFMRDIARAMYADVCAVAASWGADLIAPNMVELGGFVAAEKLGLPHVSIAANAGTARDLTSQVAEPLGWLREGAGLPPDPGLRDLYRYLHLAMTPPVFDGPAAVFPPTTRFVRRETPPRPGETLPEWAVTASRPLVLVSLGTVFYRFVDVYRVIVERLREEDIEVGVAVGLDQAPDCLGPQPPNVHVEPWLPLPSLYPLCDVLVTHGGFNSTMEALSHGVPLVVIPMAGDQPYCARRCEALGVGVAIRAHQRMSDQIRDAVAAVLADPAYRSAALRFSAANAELPGMPAIVPLLEELTARRPAG